VIAEKRSPATDAERGRVAGQGAAVVAAARARAGVDAEIRLVAAGVWPTIRLLAPGDHPFSSPAARASQPIPPPPPPYDDDLMERRSAIFSRPGQPETPRRWWALYRSMACLALPLMWARLYHLFSKWQDALAGIERYTLGYVDNYLPRRQEMLRPEARQLCRASCCRIATL